MPKPMTIDLPPDLQRGTHPYGVRTPAFVAAERLREALAVIHVTADVHAGYGVALVSVWFDLLVWTDGQVYRWWTGQFAHRSGRRLYTTYSVEVPGTVARCVAHRRLALQAAPAEMSAGSADR